MTNVSIFGNKPEDQHLETVKELNKIMENDCKNASVLRQYQTQFKVAISVNTNLENLTQHIANKHNLKMNQAWAVDYATKLAAE